MTVNPRIIKPRPTTKKIDIVNLLENLYVVFGYDKRDILEGIILTLLDSGLITIKEYEGLMDTLEVEERRRWYTSTT